MLEIDIKKLQGSIKGDMPTVLAELEFLVFNIYKNIANDLGELEAKGIVMESIMNALTKDIYDKGGLNEQNRTNRTFNS